MNEYEKFEDCPEKVANTQIHPAMFSSNYQPNSEVDYHLERCMRLLPHHNVRHCKEYCFHSKFNYVHTINNFFCFRTVEDSLWHC